MRLRSFDIFLLQKENRPDFRKRRKIYSLIRTLQKRIDLKIKDLEVLVIVRISNFDNTKTNKILFSSPH